MLWIILSIRNLFIYLFFYYLCVCRSCSFQLRHKISPTLLKSTLWFERFPDSYHTCKLHFVPQLAFKVVVMSQDHAQKRAPQEWVQKTSYMHCIINSSSLRYSKQLSTYCLNSLSDEMQNNFFLAAMLLPCSATMHMNTPKLPTQEMGACASECSIRCLQPITLAFYFRQINLHINKHKSGDHLYRLSSWTNHVSIINVCSSGIILNPVQKSHRLFAEGTRAMLSSVLA